MGSYRVRKTILITDYRQSEDLDGIEVPSMSV